MKKTFLAFILFLGLISCNNNIETPKRDSNQENTVSDSNEKVFETLKPCNNIWFKDIDELDFDSLCINNAFDDSVCSAINLLAMASEGDTNFVMREKLFFELLNLNDKLDTNSFNDKQLYYYTLFNLEHVGDGIMGESLANDLFELFKHNPCDFYQATHIYDSNLSDVGDLLGFELMFECDNVYELDRLFNEHTSLFSQTNLLETVSSLHKATKESYVSNMSIN